VQAVIEFQMTISISVLYHAIAQDCQPINSTTMTCLLPLLNLPPDFIDCNGTQRDGLAAASVTNKFHNATANVYLGFALDGYKKYVNTSKSLPYIHFTLIPLNVSFDCDHPLSITQFLGYERFITITVCINLA
jgi:hypothetical protein